MKTIFFTISILFSALSFCQSLQVATLFTEYADKSLNEVSGLETSPRLLDSFYLINDSSNGPYFYIGRKKEIERIEIKGINSIDFEDLSTYRDKENNYIVIGDIGDNKKRRNFISFHFINEESITSSKVSPTASLNFVYPKKTYNSEAFAIHPDGVLFLISKNEKGKAKLFTKKISPINQYYSRKSETLNLTQKLDLKSLSELPSSRENMVTSIDISPKGDRLTLLTYGYALEFQINNDYTLDLSSYTYIDLFNLPQQESITYGNNGDEIFYSTETHGNLKTPIYRLNLL